MSADLPAPLVPAEVDLRDFAFMPLDVRRLLTSETWMLGTGDERAAAMCLWLESWHQVPAGSLPDNDRILAHLSQCPKWKLCRDHALRGWVKCSDGRLYHLVVAEKALEAWEHKQARKRKRETDTERLRKWRETRDETRYNEPMKRVSSHDETRYETISSQRETRDVAERQGQGQGQGHIKTKSKTLSGFPPDVAPPREAKNGHHYLPIAREVLSFLNLKTGRNYQPVPANLDLIVARLKDGATEQQCRQVIAKKSREWNSDEKMAMYLRPATLFNRTKFAQYQGELGNADDARH